MPDRKFNIALLEPSTIISEGLSVMLYRSLPHTSLYRMDDMRDLEMMIIRNKLNIVILNPRYLQPDKRDFHALRRSHPGVKWIGLVYSYYDRELLSLFDGNIQITDDSRTVASLLGRLVWEEEVAEEEQAQGQLTDREQEVLLELVKGLSNKEIAERLNISVHTVISHRRNISQKTGIRSQAGLVIYAISNRILAIEDFQG